MKVLPATRNSKWINPAVRLRCRPSTRKPPPDADRHVLYFVRYHTLRCFSFVLFLAPSAPRRGRGATTATNVTCNMIIILLLANIKSLPYIVHAECKGFAPVLLKFIKIIVDEID